MIYTPWKTWSPPAFVRMPEPHKISRSKLYLKPEVVFSLVRHLSVVIADVTFPDQAVDGSLVGVGTVPQHSAVVQTKLVLGSRGKAEETKQMKGREVISAILTSSLKQN